MQGKTFLSHQAQLEKPERLVTFRDLGIDLDAAEAWKRHSSWFASLVSAALVVFQRNPDCESGAAHYQSHSLSLSRKLLSEFLCFTSLLPHSYKAIVE
jgi:hypothetical protein